MEYKTVSRLNSMHSFIIYSSIKKTFSKVAACSAYAFVYVRFCLLIVQYLAWKHKTTLRQKALILLQACKRGVYLSFYIFIVRRIMMLYFLTFCLIYLCSLMNQKYFAVPILCKTPSHILKKLNSMQRNILDIHYYNKFC